MFENLITQVENNILTITLNRPTKLNALNIALLSELELAVSAAQTNESVRVIILTGAGEKAFAAGADIAEFAHFNKQEGSALSAKGHSIFNAIANSTKPVIAAVNGFALGGGCELAMACHIRLASENARFGQPEANLGLTPGYAGTQRLVQLIGKGKALELLLTTDAIKAEEAKSLGLVNQVYPLQDLLAKAYEMASKIASKAPIAIAYNIACVEAHFKGTTPGFELEITHFGDCFDTQDFKIGTQAFLNKEQPQFIGK